MSWSDWEFVWRNQEAPAEMSSLEERKRSFEAGRTALARRLFVRNISEAAAGIGLAAFLTYLGARHGLFWSTWPVYLSAIIVLGVTAVFVGDAMRQRRRRLGPEAPFREKIEAEIAELRHQQKLIGGWWLWYLAPLGLAFGLALWSLGRVIHGRAPAGFLLDLVTTPITAAWFVILAAAVGLPLRAVIRAQRAAKAKVEPRIAELERLKRELGSGDGGA
jgi:hypothetical protein